MTTLGATDAARERARQERGVRIEVMSLEELKAWSPPCTVTTNYRIPTNRQADAEKALRNAGFRVTLDSARSTDDQEVVLAVLRHYGARNPCGDIQDEHTRRAESALRKIGIEPTRVSHGVTISGGNPGYRGCADVGTTMIMPTSALCRPQG